MVRGVNPRFDVHSTTSDEHGWTAEITLAAAPFKEATEVAITRISTGAAFTFTDRGIPLPLTVIR